MHLDETAAFVAVARARSFTRAAERLGLPKGTVSRQVARLERRLGVRLLQRTTRNMALTDLGRAYYERCVHAVETLADAERLVTEASGAVIGTLRVSMPFDFGRDWLAPWLPALRRRHPELRLELDLSQRRVDLLAEGIDVAIRGGEPMEDSTFVARKLASSRLVLCASPAYLKRRGTPRALEELRGHECVTFLRPGGGRAWRLSTPDGSTEVDLAGWLAVNELGVVREVTLGGGGIGLCEILSVQKDLASGRLRRVLPECEVGAGGLWAVYPSAHHLSPKVRAFVDFVAERLRNELGTAPSRAAGRRDPS